MQNAMESVRVDKWLWAARFYKTRSLASEAVKGGKVQVNGQRIKPAKTLVLGDTLTINKVPDSWEIIVAGLSERRLAAPLAQQLYQETADSIEKRQALSEMRKLAGGVVVDNHRKPDKKTRRQLINLKHKNIS